MKRQITLYILLAVLSLGMSTTAIAGEWIFGAKTGRVIIGDSAVDTHPTNVGFVVGYEQSIAVGDLALEGEITKTTGKGDVAGSKFEVDTQAIYLAFRSAGPVYFKAKGGFLQADLDGNKESGSSYGIGLGVGFGLAQIELEVTKTAIDPDILYASLGFQF